jgi:hypothetical protein
MKWEARALCTRKIKNEGILFRKPGKMTLGRYRPSPPTSAEAKNAWNKTSAPQHVFMTWGYLNTKIMYLRTSTDRIRPPVNNKAEHSEK